jgi:hypothetical protein
LVIGATSLIRYKRKNIPGGVAWLSGLLARNPARLVTWRSPTRWRASPGPYCAEANSTKRWQHQRLSEPNNAEPEGSFVDRERET